MVRIDASVVFYHNSVYVCSCMTSEIAETLREYSIDSRYLMPFLDFCTGIGFQQAMLHNMPHFRMAEKKKKILMYKNSLLIMRRFQICLPKNEYDIKFTVFHGVTLHKQ